MTSSARTLTLWTPRILGILVVLFIGMFALDAYREGMTFVEGLWAFLIHLSPALLLLAVVLLSWRWEWIGAMVFIALALFYAIWVTNRWDWILVISGPLLLVGILFLWSWMKHRELRAHA